MAPKETTTIETAKTYTQAEFDAAVLAAGKPKHVHRIVFRAPYTKKDGTVPNLAAADVLGCFGNLPMAVKEFALRKPDAGGHIDVYMPSGMLRGTSTVGPLGGSLMSDADAAMEATTMGPDDAKAFIARHRAKKASIAVLSDAIVGAWASLPADAKFGTVVELNLPE